MSLDVYLKIDGRSPPPAGSGIFVRRGGATIEISEEEWARLCPGCEPVRYVGPGEAGLVFHGNITHNLGAMADACGLYMACWRPEEIGVQTAGTLTPLLREGLVMLEADPERFRVLDPPNGWGDYYALLAFVRAYLDACERFPEAAVSVSR